MNFKTTFFALTLMIFFFGCAKEEVAVDQQSANTDEIQAKVDQAIAEIELDYRLTMNDVAAEDNERGVTYVEAGSVDVLNDIIASAKRNEKIILKSGDHYEYSTVMVTKSVRIIGEPGAVLYFDNEFPGYSDGFLAETGFHVQNTHSVRIEGLDIRPVGALNTIAIFLDNAPYCKIVNNTLTNFVYPLWVSQLSKKPSIYDNTLVGGGGGWGIVIEAGEKAKVMNNHSSGFFAGIFSSDDKGIAYNNTLQNNVVGILLCTVQGSAILPNGPFDPALSCQNWIFTGNHASDNLWNYLAIDGANNNVLAQNYASNAGVYDIETASETDRWGPNYPVTYNNFVLSVGGSFNDVVIKVCGNDNVAIGGQQVDTDEDPCW